MSDERLVKQAHADWHLAEHWENRFREAEAERAHYKGRLLRICQLADRFLQCLDEFPESPGYCAEHLQALQVELDASTRSGRLGKEWDL